VDEFVAAIIDYNSKFNTPKPASHLYAALKAYNGALTAKKNTLDHKREVLNQKCDDDSNIKRITDTMYKFLTRKHRNLTIFCEELTEQTQLLKNAIKNP
jgi:hypothetical protein